MVLPMDTHTPLTPPTDNPTPTTPRDPAPAPRPARRAPWIVGGALAGVLLLGGAVGAGVLLGRLDDRVTVQRTTAADTARQSGTGAGAAPPVDGSAAGPVSEPAIASTDDIELTGDTLTRAASAALEAVGGDGVVTAAEYSDDPTHRYEVEVTRADGREADVYLDDEFQVVAVQPWRR
jgi:hypothetical protein